MKKALLSLALAGAVCTSANAQPAIGSVAPDFTLTDINGTSHNLYTYLDQGYTVILDISATWCGPCWAGHQSHFMDNLYAQYGPDGTVDPGKVMILFVEGDASTTSADLHGTGTNTQGDWVSGAEYPIFDDASLNGPYQLSGFPTYVVICPNRQVMYSVAGFGSAMGQTSFWTQYIDVCPVAVEGLNGGTYGVGTPSSVCAGGPTALTAQIQNLGSVPITSATIQAKVNGEVIASTEWTGNLATYDVADVEIGSYTFNQATTEVDYETIITNDVAAGDNVKTKASTALTSEYRTWDLEVKTDQYPGEISWKVKNSSGSVVEQHTYQAGTGQAGAGGPDAGKVFHHQLQLDANECYTVEILDGYGDGLYGVSAAADTGYVKLNDGVGNLIYNFGAGYGDGISQIAKTGSTTDISEIIAVNELSLYPNPVADQLHVNLNMINAGTVTFDVMNIVGQQIQQSTTVNLNAGKNVQTINTAHLVPGIYILNIVTNNGTVQQKFVKN